MQRTCLLIEKMNYLLNALNVDFNYYFTDCCIDTFHFKSLLLQNILSGSRMVGCVLLGNVGTSSWLNSQQQCCTGL